MIPFQVDPSWYEKYWWHEPAPRRLSAFALLRRGLERFKKIQGSNVMTHASRFHKPGGPEVQLLVHEGVALEKSATREIPEGDRCVTIAAIEIGAQAHVWSCHEPVKIAKCYCRH